ncbi:phage tail domain-containing protein [Caldifermentibacillus hisashii]|uniref:Phage tail domain-containing protein n=1 Tax=Caldifermentibacillus hisashii TaxID=996558 RepID=A0ABU9K2Q7_9BACI
MLESTSFLYDNIHSSDMGVINCKVDSGLFDEGFLPSRTIIEEKIAGREKPYFTGFEYEPFEFSMTLFFEDGMSKNKRRSVARWLLPVYYKPLIFDSNPSRMFYCMYHGDSRLLHNGLEQGYVTITMRCDSPFSYTQYYSTDIYDLSNNTINGTEISIKNYGDDICKPDIYIEKVDDGDISIINYSDSGREFKITNILDGDILNIDNENEQIETDISGSFNYKNHNNIYLRLLPYSQNRLKIYGKCKIQFKYQFKLFQG